MQYKSITLSTVTDNKTVKQLIRTEIAEIPYPVSSVNFDSCEDIMSFLETNKYKFHMVLLDMDSPEGVGYDCLTSIKKNVNFNDIIIAGFYLEEDEEAIEEWFIEGLNIAFKYPQESKKFSKYFRKILDINWKLFLSGSDRRNIVLKF